MNLYESIKCKLNESQTQEIEQALNDLEKEHPGASKYVDEYYKEVIEPNYPKALKDDGTISSEWEEYSRNSANIMYSEIAWNKFAEWVKEKYNVDLNESDEDESNSIYRDGVNITEDVINLLDKSFVQLCIKQKHSVDEFKDFWNGQKQSIDEFVQSSYGEDE